MFGHRHENLQNVGQSKIITVNFQKCLCDDKEVRRTFFRNFPNAPHSFATELKKTPTFSNSHDRDQNILFWGGKNIQP